MNIKWLELWIEINSESTKSYHRYIQLLQLADPYKVDAKVLLNAGFRPPEILAIRDQSKREAQMMGNILIDIYRATEIRGLQF